MSTCTRLLALSVICDVVGLVIMFSWLGDVGLLDEGGRERLMDKESALIVAELIQVYLWTGLLLPCLGVVMEWRKVYVVSEVILDTTELLVVCYCVTVLRTPWQNQHLYLLLLNVGSSLLDALILKIPAVRSHFDSPEADYDPLPEQAAEAAEASEAETELSEVTAGTGLVLGFELPDGSRRIVDFGSHKLHIGLQFANASPIPVRHVNPSGHAADLGVQTGWKVMSVNGQDLEGVPLYKAMQILANAAWCRAGEDPAVEAAPETTESAAEPLEEAEHWSFVDGGNSSSVALSSRGNLRVFGSNFYKQLGAPKLRAGNSWLTVAAGSYHCVALTTAGQLHAWGRDDCGQVSHRPRDPPAGASWQAVAAGYRHSLVLSTDGQLQAWGSDDCGQCQVPEVKARGRWLRVAARADRSLGFWQGDGLLLVFSWGAGGPHEVQRLGALGAPSGQRCLGLASGTWHSLALFSGGELRAWGSDKYGQCRVPQLPAGQQWTAVAAGNVHSLGLSSAGELHCWGRDGDYKQCSSQPRLPEGEHWVSLGAGDGHSFGISNSGRIYGWGRNSDGQADAPEL